MFEQAFRNIDAKLEGRKYSYILEIGEIFGEIKNKITGAEAHGGETQ